MSTPVVPPYSTLVSLSSNLAPVCAGTIIHRNKSQVTSGSEINNSTYIHDVTLDTSTEIARDVVKMDTSGSTSTISLGVLNEDSTPEQTIQPIVQSAPSSTTVTSVDNTTPSVCNLTLDGSISWDKDSACLYLSSNKVFRFRYIVTDGTEPSRLALEGYSDSLLTYLPKAEWTTD